MLKPLPAADFSVQFKEPELGEAAHDYFHKASVCDLGDGTVGVTLDEINNVSPVGYSGAVPDRSVRKLVSSGCCHIAKRARWSYSDVPCKLREIDIHDWLA